MRWLRLVPGLLVAGCALSDRRGGPGAEAASRATEGATLAFRDVRVFDGDRVIPRANVFLKGDRIVALGEAPIPEGIEVIEGAGHTLLPGLMDAHVHVWHARHLEQALVFGVTTVFDMFMAPAAAKQLRESDSPGRADLRSAGQLATAPRGHGTQFGVPVPTLTRPDEAQAWVDARLAEGSDYIKIVYDGGKALGRATPTLSRQTMAALVTAAHARGKLAVVHIMDQDSAREAIGAGADGLVHLFRDRLPDADLGQRMSAGRAFVIPTLAVLRGIYEAPGAIADDPAVAPYLSAEARESLRKSFPLRASGPSDAVTRTVAQLRDAGVSILCGSDAPNPGTTFGATVHDELEVLVRAGLSPAAALTGATAAAARAFRLDDRGRIAPGLRADLLLVAGDPTVDITRSRHIVGIWRGGQRLDRDAVKAKMAAELAEAAAARAAPATKLGLINDFESGKLDNRFGAPWAESTDALLGGTSKVQLRIASAGRPRAAGKALSITGAIVPGQAPVTWAGALFWPGPKMFAPMNLSANKGLRFKARGDGKTYSVMLFSARGGNAPIVHPFKPGTRFGTVEIPWDRFRGTDATDITALLIGATGSPGSFSLLVDDIELY